MVEYIVVADAEESDDAIELPCEEDGIMLLTTVQAQFPGALGLRYRGPSGKAWRGIKLLDEMLHPPEDGWSDRTYIVTLPKSARNDSGLKEVSSSKPVFGGSSEPKDLIVLGLSFAATDDEVRTYFEQYGELELCEVKKDKNTGRSKGFGFIKYKDLSSCQAVMAKKHSISGRLAEVQIPNRQGGMDTPCKLFVGMLPLDATEIEIEELFKQYGDLTDVYLPKQDSKSRGFAFITFADQDVAAKVLKMRPPPTLKGKELNITYAEKKVEGGSKSGGGRGGGYGYGGYGSPRDFGGPRDFGDPRDFRRGSRDGPRDFGYDDRGRGSAYGGPGYQDRFKRGYTKW